jgi:hypothetical protein
MISVKVMLMQTSTKIKQTFFMSFHLEANQKQLQCNYNTIISHVIIIYQITKNISFFSFLQHI